MLDLFDIYLQWDTDKVRALFKASPWMMAQTLNQLEAYLRLFKMYKFDRDVLYEVVGCPPFIHSLAAQRWKHIREPSERPPPVRQTAEKELQVLGWQDPERGVPEAPGVHGAVEVQGARDQAAYPEGPRLLRPNAETGVPALPAVLPQVHQLVQGQGQVLIQKLFVGA